MVAQIFAKLPAAEVIMTFAADALLNFLTKNPSMIKTWLPLELSNQIEDLMNYKQGLVRGLLQKGYCWSILRDQQVHLIILHSS